MNALSVVIITFNEKDNIARCISSVKKIADEIIVLDSNSTDGTNEIASSLGASVFQHPFQGYAAQKNHATSLARNNWILSLDADEEVSPTLLASISDTLQNPRHTVYQMPRLTSYCGHWIRHCGWYPDRQTRLFDRNTGKWKELSVHEYWESNDPGQKKGLLHGNLLHYSFNSVADHLRKIDRYTQLAATDAAAKGKSATLLKIILSPFWHFFSEYFLKLGFLDGYYGFVVCRLSAYSAYIKYTRIRQLAKK